MWINLRFRRLSVHRYGISNTMLMNVHQSNNGAQLVQATWTRNKRSQNRIKISFASIACFFVGWNLFDTRSEGMEEISFFSILKIPCWMKIWLMWRTLRRTASNFWYVQILQQPLSFQVAFLCLCKRLSLRNGGLFSNETLQIQSLQLDECNLIYELTCQSKAVLQFTESVNTHPSDVVAQGRVVIIHGSTCN